MMMMLNIQNESYLDIKKQNYDILKKIFAANEYLLKQKNPESKSIYVSLMCIN